MASESEMEIMIRQAQQRQKDKEAAERKASPRATDMPDEIPYRAPAEPGFTLDNIFNTATARERYQERMNMDPPPPPLPRPPVAPTPGFVERMARAAGLMARDLDAAYQGTSPNVATVTGKELRKPLGELHVSDIGEGFYGPDGFIPIDPQQHVVLHDPQTNTPLVYARTPESEEGPLMSAGRVLGFGAVTSPTAPMASVQRSPGLAAQRLRAHEALRIPEALPHVTDSRTIQRGAQALRELPVVGEAVDRPLKGIANRTAQVRQQIADRYGMATTRDTAGAAIKRGLGLGKHDTYGFKARAANTADGLLERIPIPGNARGDVANTLQALRGPSERFPNAPDLGPLLTNPKFIRFAEAIEEGQGRLSWNEIKEFRSWVGRQNLYGGDIPAADLNQLYGALSRDMEAIAQARGPGAVQAWRRYNRYYGAMKKRINDVLQKVYDAPSDEAAFNQMLQASKEKGAANLKKLRAVRRSLEPEEWNEVASTIIRKMGVVEATQEGDVFNPLRFLSEYRGLSRKGKDILFGGNQEGRRMLDQLDTVMESQREMSRLGAGSPTMPLAASILLGGGTLAGVHFDYFTLMQATMTAMAAAGAGTAIMNPKVTRWLLGMNKLTTAPRVAAHVNRMQLLAREIPQLQPFADTLKQGLP